tara:strand:+ start:2088 stop:2450 length:363 start_codon:yes stop_codon:yes gene_type:complete
MAGSISFTEITQGSVKKIKAEWTSDASGDVSGNSTTNFYNGKLIMVATDPHATAPTDNYDIVLNDSDSIDLAQGNLANRDTADTEYVAEANLGAVVNSKITPVVSNAGNAKRGTIYIYLR